MSEKRPQISNLEYGDDNETDVGDYDAEKTAEQLSDVSETEQSSPLNPPKRHAASPRVVRKKGQESTSSTQVAGVLENYFAKKPTLKTQLQIILHHSLNLRKIPLERLLLFFKLK